MICRGNEASVSECSLQSVSSSLCDTRRSSAGLICHISTDRPIIYNDRRPVVADESMRLSLAAGTNSYNGIVQVETLQHTAHICADDVTELIATVICRDIFGASRIYGELDRAERSYMG